MNPIVKNIIGLMVGIIVGIVVNMAIVIVGPMIIPLPEGVDTTTAEGIKQAMSVMEPRHFISPFLAHALGTLAGAFVAVKICASYKLTFALVIGAFFLSGGIMMVVDVGGPTWFIVLDLVVAYLPAAWLGHKIGAK